MKRNNFNYRMAVIAMTLLAVLATGCKKESIRTLRLGITTENFRNGGNSKVAFNPANVQAANTWIVGEPIKVNSTMCYVAQADIDFEEAEDVTKYYLTTDPAAAGNQSDDYVPADGDFPMTALYPGASFGGNVVTVGDDEMVLSNLVINRITGTPVMQTMAFPMMAEASAATSSLLFHHMTGGLKLTLANGDATEDVDLATLKIVAWGTSDSTDNMSYSNYTVRWAQDGPTVPGGHPGDMTGDLNANYSSDMRFTLRTDGVDGVTVPANDSITFCVPITITSVHYITITGYNAADEEVFCKTANLSSTAHPHGVTVERNKMYAVRTLPMNTTDAK